MKRIQAVRAKMDKHTGSKAHAVDKTLAVAKAVVFLLCMTLGALPLIFAWQLNLVDSALVFLFVFASMAAGLLLYFSLGCLVLRVAVPDYLRRLRLGERGHAGETAIMAAVCNLGVHSAVLCVMGVAPSSIALIFASTVFFSFPVYYLVTTLWGLQPEVRAVVSGSLRLNTTHFANVPRKVRSQDEYASITISLPVYTESNEVIFKTIQASQRALAHYQSTTGKEANLVVSDDGLAKLLGGRVSAWALEQCLAAPESTQLKALGFPNIPHAACAQVAERILFYRRENISFVARPLQGRRGKFKKGGNLNYTYGIARLLEKGASLDSLFAPGGPYAEGYAEGNIRIHELICLLDKDSGLAPGVLAATAPEFAADPALAFTQHTTHAANEHENYFAWLQARFTNMVYRVALTSKALQGLQVHLMGHNAFLRRSFLEETGNWSEDRVSEDYAKALDAYSTGWHAKHIAFAGLEFTEQVCTNFIEETDKQLRYCYGISEVVLGGRHKLSAAMAADMILYYLSYFNLAAALPLIVILLATHQIYYLSAGILINAVLFLLLPIIQGWLLGSDAGFSSGFQTIRYFLLNTLAYLGHAYSMLRGFVAYFADRIRSKYEPFGVTSVEKKEHSFAVGRALLRSYIRRNVPMLVIAAIIVVGCAFVLRDVPPHIVRPLVVVFLIAHIVAPVVLTPQLFARLKPSTVQHSRDRAPQRLQAIRRLPARAAAYITEFLS